MNNQITLCGTIKTVISKTINKSTFVEEFIRNHRDATINSIDDEMVEKVWSAFVKKAEHGLIDLGFVSEVEYPDDLDFEIEFILKDILKELNEPKARKVIRVKKQ